MTLTHSCKALSGFLIHGPYLPVHYGVDEEAEDRFCFACDTITAPLIACDFVTSTDLSV